MNSLFISLGINLLLGIAVYCLDRSVFQNAYRSFYDFTHKKKLSKKEERGFVYGRKNKERCIVATCVAVATSLLLALVSNTTVFEQIFTLIYKIPTIWFGIIIAPVVYLAIGQKEKVFETLDGFEDKVTNMEPSEVARKAARTVRTKSAEFVGEVTDAFSLDGKVGDKKPTEETPPSSPKTKEPEKEKEEDPRAVLDRFSGKKPRKGKGSKKGK